MQRLCPICKSQETTVEFKPFCSKRCADEDLLAWLKGSYALPSEENDLSQTTIDDESRL